MNNKLLQLKFSIDLRWTDTRMKVHNLQDLMGDNAIKLEDCKGLWMPNVLFLDTKKHLTTASLSTEEQSEIFVMRKGNAKKDNWRNLIQNFVYLGEDTEIIKKNSYTIEFICAYDLEWYPFDVQVCEIRFTIREGIKITFLWSPKNWTPFLLFFLHIS